MSVSRRRFVSSTAAGIVGAGAALRGKVAADSGGQGRTVAPSDCVTIALVGRGYGSYFYGTDGTLFVDRSGYELVLETAGQDTEPTSAYINEMKVAQSTVQPWERPRRMRPGRAAYARGDGSGQ